MFPGPGPGRPKGSVNKSTAAVKAALEEAFDQLGGVPSLLQWARREPGEFYKLWSKLIPKDIHIDASLDVGALLDEMVAARKARKK